MDQKTALAEAISLTDEIIELLDSGDFEAVGDLELKRQTLIKQAFTDSIEEIDQIKARHLQKLNLQVVAKLTLLKKSVLLQQAKIRNASRATMAYRSHAESSD